MTYKPGDLCVVTRRYALHNRPQGADKIDIILWAGDCVVVLATTHEMGFITEKYPITRVLYKDRIGWIRGSGGGLLVL